MKTNQIIKRPMGVFVVEQRTRDGFFFATGLLKQWNKTVGNQEVILNTHLGGVLKKKDLDDYLSIGPTKDFIDTIIARESLSGRNDVVVATRGKYNGGTWMHPLLFIDFAMWLNSTFKYDVLKFVYDQMIRYRREAGDAYKDLASAVSKVSSKEEMGTSMAYISKGINYIVFGEHYPMVRNDKGTEELQRELFELEKKVADLINEGFLKKYDDVIAYLQKKWREKYTPKVFK